MKLPAIIVSTAAVLTAGVFASGFTLDAAGVCSIAFASGIVGLFVDDYRRIERYSLEPVKKTAVAPVRRTQAERRATPGQVFASVAIFNTTIA